MDAYDEELLRHAARSGLTIGSDGKWTRIPGFAGQNPPTDEKVRYLNESARKHDTDARLTLQWVGNLAYVVETLARDGEGVAGPFLSVFWIRLHGVIADMLPEAAKFFRFLNVDPSSQVARPRSPLEFALTKFRRMDALRHVFSEDELTYADYRRNTECHPTQDSYDVRWHPKQQTIMERRGIPAIGREFTVAELDAAIGRVLRAHANEIAIAVAFARRIAVHMPPLLEVMQQGARSA
jgi:hypothetical protein